MRAPGCRQHACMQGRLAAALLLVVLLSGLQFSTAAELEKPKDGGVKATPAGQAGGAGVKQSAQQQAPSNNAAAAVGVASASAKAPAPTVVELSPEAIKQLAAAAAAAANAAASSHPVATAAAASPAAGRSFKPQQMLKAASAAAVTARHAATQAAVNARRSASKAARSAVSAASKAAAQAVPLIEALAESDALQEFTAPGGPQKPQFSGTNLAWQTVGKPDQASDTVVAVAGPAAPSKSPLTAAQVLKAEEEQRGFSATAAAASTTGRKDGTAFGSAGNGGISIARKAAASDSEGVPTSKAAGSDATAKAQPQQQPAASASAATNGTYYSGSSGKKPNNNSTGGDDSKSPPSFDDDNPKFRDGDSEEEEEDDSSSSSEYPDAVDEALKHYKHHEHNYQQHTKDHAAAHKHQHAKAGDSYPPHHKHDAGGDSYDSDSTTSHQHTKHHNHHHYAPEEDKEAYDADAGSHSTDGYDKNKKAGDDSSSSYKKNGSSYKKERDSSDSYHAEGEEEYTAHKKHKKPKRIIIINKSKYSGSGKPKYSYNVTEEEQPEEQEHHSSYSHHSDKDSSSDSYSHDSYSLKHADKYVSSKHADKYSSGGGHSSKHGGGAGYKHHEHQHDDDDGGDASYGKHAGGDEEQPNKPDDKQPGKPDYKPGKPDDNNTNKPDYNPGKPDDDNNGVGDDADSYSKPKEGSYKDGSSHDSYYSGTKKASSGTKKHKHHHTHSAHLEGEDAEAISSSDSAETVADDAASNAVSIASAQSNKRVAGPHGAAMIDSVLAELQARLHRHAVVEDMGADEDDADIAGSLPYDVFTEGADNAESDGDDEEAEEYEYDEDETDSAASSAKDVAVAPKAPAATPAQPPASQQTPTPATASPPAPKDAAAAGDEYEYVYVEYDEDDAKDAAEPKPSSKQVTPPVTQTPPVVVAQSPASGNSSGTVVAPPAPVVVAQPPPTPANDSAAGTDDDEYEYVEYVYEYEDEAAKEAELKQNPPHPLAGQRTDIRSNGSVVADKPDLELDSCGNSIAIPVPRFATGHGGPKDAQIRTNMKIEEVAVPARLPRDLIQKVKGYVMSQMRTFDPETGKVGEDPVRVAYAELKRANKTSGFVHPAGVLGPAELALLKVRLQDANNTNLQKKALEILQSGEGVPLKKYPPTNWAPPTATPAKLGAGAAEYSGPYSIESIKAGWYGSQVDTKCNDKFPNGAPKELCGHVSLVELDGQMSYKQALAYWATGNVTYAQNALALIDSWSKSNKELGLQYQNGPLESGWAVAAMAKSLELLREVPGWKASYDSYMKWTNNVTMPSMDYYVLNISTPAILRGVPHVYNNWHSTVAEAWMSVSLLTDDLPRFVKAVKLYNETIHSYLKWGKGEWAAGGRVPGECSETLRDIYHSEFGLGGLLQIAEMAWQQDFDLYSTAKYALVAAMELHARILNAGRNEALLPPGFKFVESMPKPAEGAFWKFDIRTQTWWAHNTTSPEQRLSELKDGVKYLVGIMWLPTGWEMGYNHFAGRLGIPMPETAKLLAAHPVDFYSFHWGLGTITHADTATSLWRQGLELYLVCQDPFQKADAIHKALESQKQQQPNTPAASPVSAPAAPAVAAPQQQQPQQQQQSSVNATQPPKASTSIKAEQQPKQQPYGPPAPPAEYDSKTPAAATPAYGDSSDAYGDDDHTDLHSMTRQELLQLLYEKVNQYGLSRKQQLKLANSVLREREHEAKKREREERKKSKHAAAKDADGKYGGEASDSDSDDDGYSPKKEYSADKDDYKSTNPQKVRIIHKHAKIEDLKAAKAEYKDYKEAEEEVWEKNKELWHEFKAEREEQLRQAKEDYKKAVKALKEEESKYPAGSAEQQYGGAEEPPYQPEGNYTTKGGDYAAAYPPGSGEESDDDDAAAYGKAHEHHQHHHHKNHTSTHHDKHKPAAYPGAGGEESDDDDAAYGKPHEHHHHHKNHTQHHDDKHKSADYAGYGGEESDDDDAAYGKPHEHHHHHKNHTSTHHDKHKSADYAGYGEDSDAEDAYGAFKDHHHHAKHNHTHHRDDKHKSYDSAAYRGDESDDDDAAYGAPTEHHHAKHNHTQHHHHYDKHEQEEKEEYPAGDSAYGKHHADSNSTSSYGSSPEPYAAHKQHRSKEHKHSKEHHAKHEDADDSYTPKDATAPSKGGYAGAGDDGEDSGDDTAFEHFYDRDHQHHHHKGNRTRVVRRRVRKDRDDKHQKRVYLAYGRQGKALIRTATEVGSAMHVLDLPNNEQVLLTATPLSTVVAQLQLQQQQLQVQQQQQQQQQSQPPAQKPQQKQQ